MRPNLEITISQMRTGLEHAASHLQNPEQHEHRLAVEQLDRAWLTNGNFAPGTFNTPTLMPLINRGAFTTFPHHEFCSQRRGDR